MSSKKIAVILCGSGYKDGSEIRESVASLLALSKNKAQVQCFAPNDNQYDVVNCLTGETVTNEARNMLVESARIARSQVKALNELNVNQFDAVILPGGYGVAKNLCNFALKGAQGEANPQITKVLKEFYNAKKPIGAICIAPALVALTFKDANFTLTLGAASETASELEKLGHKHQVCTADKCVVDKENRVVSTPAYMYDDAPLADIYEGIEALTKEVLQMS